MVQFYEEIPENVIPWIHQQKMFFVASSPLSGEGHVNLSPKGFEGTFHIENSKKVWYEDMSGSGMSSHSIPPHRYVHLTPTVFDFFLNARHRDNLSHPREWSSHNYVLCIRRTTAYRSSMGQRIRVRVRHPRVQCSHSLDQKTTRIQVCYHARYRKSVYCT